MRLIARARRSCQDIRQRAGRTVGRPSGRSRRPLEWGVFRGGKPEAPLEAVVASIALAPSAVVQPDNHRRHVGQPGSRAGPFRDTKP